MYKRQAVDSPDNLYLVGDSYIPTHNTTLLAGIGLYLLLMDDEPGAEVYCVSPYSKILTEDLHWVNAGDLAVGQSVWGFDEYAPKNETYRKLRPSVVLSTTKVRQPSYRLYMEDGRCVECSATPVSYTHLDVYKRQRLIWARAEDQNRQP